MNKQNSLITRYCLAVVAIVALLGPLAQNGRGDFVLWYDEQITVNSHHNQGILYDTSRAFIVSGGSVHNLYAYNYSDVNISGGSVDYLYPYDSSTVNVSGGSISGYGSAFNACDFSVVNISGGTISYLYAHDSSTVGVSGGSISYGLNAYDFSAVSISGGSVGGFTAYDSSGVDISGGHVNDLYAYGSSAVNLTGGDVGNLDAFDISDVTISGGGVSKLYARNSSTVTFYGQNFRLGAGLAFDGERILGTGILSGEWMDGTRWAVNIIANDPAATILAVPESEHRPFCVKYPRMDFNGDCKVDFADFAIMASSWLECNLVPESACWE